MSAAKDGRSADYNVNVRIIVFSVIILVLNLLTIDFIRTYANSKQRVVQKLRLEAANLENTFSNDITYSEYLIRLMSTRLSNNYQDINYIEQTLRDYVQSSNFNNFFGWRKYSWLDENFKEVVTSTNGIEKSPREPIYAKKLEHLQNNKLAEAFGKKSKQFSINKTNAEYKKLDPVSQLLQILTTRQKPSKFTEIIFYTSKTPYKSDSLKLISNLADVDGKRVGSIVLSYDIATMIRRLSASKRSHYANFILLNEDLEIVAQSKPSIPNIVTDNDRLSEHIIKALRHLGFIAESEQDKPLSMKLRNVSGAAIGNTKEEQELGDKVSSNIWGGKVRTPSLIDLERRSAIKPIEKNPHLDIPSGLNYYIKKIDDLPFILIVNFDKSQIEKDIFDAFYKKLIEGTVFASIFLFIVISIYKRETWLRAKSEEATAVANKATRAKSDFLAFTAHEIRSPLGFILTGSELMMKELFGNLPEVYKQYAAGINKNSNLILDFLTDILDENQIVEGRFKIVNGITMIKDVVNPAIEVNTLRFNDRKVDIVEEFDDNLPRLICDQRRLVQVMSNIISNAIKYSPDDTKIAIKVKVFKESLEIQVIDQGIGMSEVEIKQLINANGFVHKKSHSRVESYGLGLAIVKMLLDAHDAELLIKSNPKRGTTVKIIFPKYKFVYIAEKSKNVIEDKQ